jgi:ABC-2 type transport system permease protein
VGVVARSLLEEKRLRVLDRVRAAPVPAAALLAGKVLCALALGVTSLAVIWLATSLTLGAAWGDPLGVTVLIAASALAIAGVAGLVAALARSEQVADSLTSLTTFVLALVGGNFIPPGELPPLLGRLTWVTPNGWALHGFAELSAGGGGPGDVLPHAGVLVLWGVVTGVVAARLLPGRLAGA